MPPERFLPRYVAEPPQEPEPYGRWATRLGEAFLAAAEDIEEADGDGRGDPGELRFFPDRTWHGRTFMPVTCRTANGHELFGHVRFVPGTGADEPRGLHGEADATTETADRHPEWRLDLGDAVVGAWRGEPGEEGAMTLIWGEPLVPGGVYATAELDGVTLDRCAVRDGRFTLLALDDYQGDVLDVAVFDDRGVEIARESLYADEDDGDDGSATGTGSEPADRRT